MPIEYDLRTYLLADATVSGFIDSRCYPVHLPERPQFPALTYQMVSRVRPARPSAGPPALAEMRIQIDVWTHDRDGQDAYDEAKDLADAVRQRLDGTTGSLGSGLASVQDVRLDSERDSGYDADARLYRVSMDFRVWHTEQSP